MASAQQAGGRAAARRRRGFRGGVLAVAVCAAAALAAAGCSSGSSPSGGSGGTSGAQPGGSSLGGSLPASRALSLAASQARQVRSFTATIAVTTTGAQTPHATGRIAEQVRPAVAAREVFHTAGTGQTVPGRLEILITGNAMYMKLGVLAKQLGKPWVKVPFASLKRTSGFSLAPLIHELQGSNPLADAQMLSVSRDVHRVGPATVNGVPATEYTGTLNVAQALARLSPQARRELGPALATSGVTTSHFTAWIDGQHTIRKIAQTESAGGGQISTVVTITSINQPVHISAPPASQVTRMPGL